MKLLVPFELDEKFKRIGREIVGNDNIIWYPDDGAAEIILVRGNDFPRDRKFRLIQTVSAGTDHIDFSNIPKETMVASNAGAFSVSVAEHAFALILERTKRISIFENETRGGVYKPHPTRLLYGKTMGIIGYGGIGSRSALIAKSLGMRVIAIGRGHRDINADVFTDMDGLDNLLSSSDIILLSIPLTNSTRGMIGEEQLKKVKRDCIIVNVARAEIVKKEALLKFVDSNKDAAYLTDVWWGEPRLDDSNRDNVVITPHVAGGLSGEVMEFAYRQAFENIRQFMEGKTVSNVVKKEDSLYLDRNKIGI
jgi:glycerate dehydrogenase